MVTTELGQSVRTRPIDDVVSKYYIELNHSDRTVRQGLCTFHRCDLTAVPTAGDSSTDPLIHRLRSIPARTTVPAMNAAESLINLKLARNSETRQRSSYRGKFASCLATTSTFWQHADRGPPGSSKRPCDVQQDSRRESGQIGGLRRAAPNARLRRGAFRHRQK